MNLDRARHLPISASRAWLALVLGLAGAAASVASIYATPAEGLPKLGCAMEALNCTTALTSRFAKIGGIPLGVFGLFYFTFWTLNLRAFQRTSDPVYRWFFSWVTMLGAITSLTLGTIMFFVLKAPCLYCLIVHTSNLLAVFLLWPMMQFRPSGTATRDNLWHFASLAAISLLAAGTLRLAADNRDLRAKLHDSTEQRAETLF